jgi:hypothetical protein
VSERNGPRLWILLCAMGCFLAGMLLGLSIPGIAAACRADTGAESPDGQYVRQMAADFGLSAAQQQALHAVLQRHRDEQLAVFRHASFEQLPEALRMELTAARRRQTERIHELLNDEQQRLYDDWSRRTGSPR